MGNFSGGNGIFVQQNIEKLNVSSAKLFSVVIYIAKGKALSKFFDFFLR